MSESQSNIGNEEQSYEQSYQQQSQSYVPFEDANAGIKSELHTIVDKLQLDEPPSAQKGRPLWQRVLTWAVPLWLVAFFVVWCYNARVDTCGGAKVKYRGNVLCIASERDYLLLNETYETEFLARDTSEPMPIDSLNQKKYDDLTEMIKSKYADTTAQDVDIRTRLTFLNALRGNGLDSASYCRNLAMGYYNFAVNYLNKGKNDSACLAYRFLKDWHWKDSVLTKAELAVLEQVCENKTLTPFKEKEKYGYKNDKGQVVIWAMYDDAHVFLENLAAVKVGKLWGFINVNNNMVIQPQFGYAYGFAESMALISDERNLYGYVNKTGQLVIPPQYEMAERFKQGIARVKLKKADTAWICLDKTGKVVACVAQSQPKNELKQEKIPPLYKEPALPTSQVLDSKIGNLPPKRLETVSDYTENQIESNQATNTRDIKPPTLLPYSTNILLDQNRRILKLTKCPFRGCCNELLGHNTIIIKNFFVEIDGSISIKSESSVANGSSVNVKNHTCQKAVLEAFKENYKFSPPQNGRYEYKIFNLEN